MFSWLGGKGSEKKKEVVEVRTVVEGLKRMYKAKLLPLEEMYKFGEFHSPCMNDGDFDAKPMVLLIGQYSTGKTTFIRYLLERDFPGMRIGPEPTTDKFSAIMHGAHEQATPGNALAVNPAYQFRALQQFGNAFLSRLEGIFVPSPVLESITLIDTPGILSGEKQRLHRGYDFEAVVEWFADRADMIVMLFDAHKLDISDEFRRVIEAIKKHQEKMRIVLNKADTISTQQLMRIYGALMWSLGKVMQTPEVCRVYIGSFWDRPLQFDENRRLFEAEQDDLFNDVQSLPRTSAVRKLNHVIKRARLAKTHAFILSHLRSEMPSVFGKESKKNELITGLANVFNHIHKTRQVPIGDFPSVKHMQNLLGEYDFTKFPKLDPRLIELVDQMLLKDIGDVMKLLPKEEAASKDRKIVGGAFGFSDSNPFSDGRDLSKTSAFDQGWIISDDTAKYDTIFDRLKPNAQGKLTGNVVREEMVKSKLPNSVLKRIWTLADIDQDGMLDRDEFAVAMFLVDRKLAGDDIPEKLSEKLIPPSKKRYFIEQLPKAETAPSYTSSVQPARSMDEHVDENAGLGDFVEGGR